MRCTFCSSPAAPPRAACRYGPRTLACSACVEAFWTWLDAHFCAHGREAAVTFYEAAALFSSSRPDRRAASDLVARVHDVAARRARER